MLHACAGMHACMHGPMVHPREHTAASRQGSCVRPTCRATRISGRAIRDFHDMLDSYESGSWDLLLGSMQAWPVSKCHSVQGQSALEKVLLIGFESELVHTLAKLALETLVFRCQINFVAAFG